MGFFKGLRKIGDNVIASFGKEQIPMGGGEFVAQGWYDANFSWSRTNVALGPFNTNATAPAITVDALGKGYTVDTTDDDLPTIKITDAPPGIYVVTASFTLDFGAASTQHIYALSDGSQTRGRTGLSVGANLADFGRPTITLVGAFTYSSTATRTFEVYGAASSSSTLIDNASARQLVFTVIRYKNN